MASFSHLTYCILPYCIPFKLVVFFWQGLLVSIPVNPKMPSYGALGLMAFQPPLTMPTTALFLISQPQITPDAVVFCRSNSN